MAFQFPWTNLHELNLDWFLSKFKQFTDNFLGTTATAESVPYGTQPSVTVTGGELDDDTDIVDPFTFNFKIPAGQQGEQGVQGVPGQDGFSPVATVTKSGSVATITITDANGTTTTTISDGEVTQAQLDTKAPAILSTVSGSIAHFSDGADNLPMSELIVGITPSQSGSGDPAPDNIRPISGWTGVSITQARKNLLPTLTGVTNINGLTSVVNADGSLTVTGTATGSGGYITSAYTNLATAIKEDIFITFSTTTNVPGRLRFFLDSSTADIQSGNNKHTILVSSNNPITKTRLYLFTTANTAYNFTIYPQLELGTIATAYDEYVTPLNGTVDWSATAGTVYGGNLNVTTGVLTVTDGYIASYNGETLPSTWISDRDVYAPGTTPTTGAQVVYTLATPQTYQLTPQQVNTLLGVNNIWCNTGVTTVTYTADTMLYIQNLTQPTEDDMIANTAIANGKFFMIGNNLYRATTAIASGSQIIPGTNATHMSLADALNLL